MLNYNFLPYIDTIKFILILIKYNLFITQYYNKLLFKFYKPLMHYYYNRLRSYNIYACIYLIILRGFRSKILHLSKNI